MPAKILIAEDNPANRELMIYLLNAFGHQTLEAQNGKECLERMADQQVDLVLMDLQMPIMDGFKALYAIKKNPTWQDIPVIAITALAMLGDRENGLNAGFHGYLSKPIEPENFVAQIDAFLPVHKRYASTHIISHLEA